MTDTNRIDNRFKILKAEGRSALVTFITAGDPDRKTSANMLRGLPRAGADIIELGVPFSDPMADGPAIQDANLRALSHGMSLSHVLEMVSDFRRDDMTTPIILMGYYNPIYRMGPKTFCENATLAGVDGVIVVDLPPEEDMELRQYADTQNIRIIRLATPTTRDGRLARVLDGAGGFLYYVSITGVTGTAKPDIGAVANAVSEIKKATDLPVCVGFGITNGASARDMAQVADGVVVGSAIVRQITASLDSSGAATAETVRNVHTLVQDLAAGVRGAMA